MTSTMTLWDNEPQIDLSAYNRPKGKRRRGSCERCGRDIPEAMSPNRNWLPKRFCSELCRKRAERARWKAKWKVRGINKYIGGRAK